MNTLAEINTMKSSRKAKKLILITFGVVFAACVLCFFYLYLLREVSATTSGSCLAQLRPSISGYYERYNSFPEYLSDDKETETWSWRVVLPHALTQFGRQDDKIQYDYAWDSDQNAKALESATKYIGRHFSIKKSDREKGLSVFVAVKGKGTIWTETNLGNISDPYKYPNMIMVIELPQSKNFWAEPGDDITPDQVIQLFQEDGGLVKNSKQPIFSTDNWPKFYLTVYGEIRKFSEIKNVEELRKLLIIEE